MTRYNFEYVVVVKQTPPVSPCSYFFVHNMGRVSFDFPSQIFKSRVYALTSERLLTPETFS